MASLKVLKAALFAAFAVLMAPNANAQAWTDPTGRYSLDYERVGWVSETPSEEVYLNLLSSAAQARDKFIGCDARVLGPIPGTAAVDQAGANLGSSRFEVQNLLNVVPDARDPTVEHLNIDGIEVVDMRFTRAAQGGVYFHWRTFYLATPNGVVQHQIQCGGVLPFTSADEAEIDALLGTLRFISAN